MKKPSTQNTGQVKTGKPQTTQPQQTKSRRSPEEREEDPLENPQPTEEEENYSRVLEEILEDMDKKNPPA